MRNELPRGLAAATLALLAACRTTPPAVPTSPAWQLRCPQLQARAHFALKGRVAVAAGGQGFNASLRWAQEGAASRVALEGPLGAGAVHISAQGNELNIATANGTRLESDAARAELSARLGFDPPLASLRYWVLGVPDPAQPAAETLDEVHQRLARLDQAGWRIDYGSYMAVGAEWLPARVTLERDDVRVRLIVDNWQS
ncbi:MAG TPA: lipoprotein insertase outer membrane protein LolB [Steroidobacteraceae bacterium]|nr:lipoprotein insertase outer membrane protein LolB [Steroidobacteraceae bacterium]